MFTANTEIIIPSLINCNLTQKQQELIWCLVEEPFRQRSCTVQRMSHATGTFRILPPPPIVGAAFICFPMACVRLVCVQGILLDGG
jgi:hypothetical protein